MFYGHFVGQNTSVGLATICGMDGPGIESRWGREFLALQAGPKAYWASFMMGTEPLFRGQNGRSVALTTHALSRLGVKKKEKFYFYHPSGRYI